MFIFSIYDFSTEFFIDWVPVCTGMRGVERG